MPLRAEWSNGHLVQNKRTIIFYLAFKFYIILCNNKKKIFSKRDDEESRSTIIFLQRASVAEKKQKIVD